MMGMPNTAGEGAGMGSRAGDSSGSFPNSYLSVDIPLDGMGFVSFPAAEIISPVFTLWTTLVIMYIGEPWQGQLVGHCIFPAFLESLRVIVLFVCCAANSIADYNAAATLQSSSQRRRSHARSVDWRSERQLRRRHSADFSKRRQHGLAGLGRQSLDVRSSCVTAPMK
jgi:Flp pilus assembly protein TadB